MNYSLVRKRKKLLVFLSFLVIFFVWIIILQAQSYKYPSKHEITIRINYLQRVINESFAPGNEIFELRKENPEWMLFSYAFTSYAMTNIALRDTSFTKSACSIIKTSINQSISSEVYSSYGIDSLSLNVDSLNEYSVLYLGHLNLMMGCYRLLCPDNTFNNLNDVISRSLFDRYSNTVFLNLESYPGSIWIPDNTVALASLKLHSKNTGSNYQTICDKWIDYAKQNYIDKNTGILYSIVNPKTGEALEEPRGSMIGWSIMFINQFDSIFAKELYFNYKEHFSRNYLIFRPFKERYNSSISDDGDIDSGPVFIGFSIPASQFALSNSILSGDFKTARKIERLIDFGTKEIGKTDELKYKTRFVDINISPMAEALVLYSLTVTSWDKK